MKKKYSGSQPDQQYVPATSSNLFLDREGHENEWEPEYLRKISDYYKNMGLIEEQTLPIPRDLYGGLEDVIEKSGFHLEDNEYADFYRNLEQTDAARTLNRALNNYFKELNIPIKFAVISIDEFSSPKLQDNDNPNRFVVSAGAGQNSRGKGVVDLYAVVSVEDFDSSLVDPKVVAKEVATVIRHEMVHDRQYDSLAKDMGISRKAAKKKFEEWGLIPPEGAPRKDYLKSHIEIDAFGHEFADRLAQKFGLEKAELMVATADVADLEKLANDLDAEMSDNFVEYYKDHPKEKFTNRLQKKIRKYLKLFRSEGIYESKFERKETMKITKNQLRRIIKEAMDYDPLGDAGVPHVGAGPKYALAFVDASYGDRRMELVVREEDTELARKVMKKMRKQGQVSGVQPTRQKFDPRDVTTREDLERMLSEATVSPKLPNLDPHYEDGWNDATVYGEPRQTPTHPPKAVDAYWDGYQDGEDHARRFEEPPMLEAKLPSRSRMKELKDAAWAKVSERVAFLPYDVRSVRIVPHQNLSDNERVEPEFEDQMMMRVYVKDRNGRNPVFDVVMNLASGRAEGISKVK